MKTKNVMLLFAGILSFGVAIFQLVISIVPKWSAYFGAGDALVSKPLLLLGAGLVMTVVFVIFGLYGLSGAGMIRRLPLLRLGIFVIGCLYLYRSLPFILQILGRIIVLPSMGEMELPMLLVTRGSFVTGLAYLAGLATAWRDMQAQSSLKTKLI